MAPSILVDYSEQKELNKRSKDYSVAMMGKTQFSKGSGFVSDYRHGVETVAESEGFGSSGRVDTETTASDGSCAPKRKVISLNADADSFGIPLQVLSVSKMSRLEKRELKVRLQTELDQVRALQKKLAMRFSNFVAVSSSNDVQKRPTLDRFNKFSFGQEQVQKNVPSSRNANSTKRGLTGKVQPRKPAAPLTTPYASLFKQCEALLKRLMGHQFGWVFNEPVDVVKLNIPDYFTVIKHPMDFGTIKKKLATGKYISPREFLVDVRLTISNATTYNPVGNHFHVMAIAVSKFFEQRWKAIEKKLPVEDSAAVAPKSSIPTESEFASATRTLPSKKRKISSTDYQVKTQPVQWTQPVQRTMSTVEKLKLGKDLEPLLPELPTHIYDLLKVQGQTNEEGAEVEVDLDCLSVDTLFTLRKLVDDYLRENQAKKAQAEPCEMEILNESGLSNSSMQPCRGNDPVDEDVDIGGNDPPISIYPPVQIEKDKAHRNSKCSSSSSSSSDSASSSSDSDSSSSGSDSDDDNASSPANKAQKATAALAQDTRNYVDPHDANQSSSGLDQLEQNSQLKPASVEADSRQEGESAPPERQVSPDKLYRAALLRNRFADTILKAREKALDKGDKDPEILRREREELERKQREEKARLQAEAKAAEDARRQAEAEAAAEAKRKREIEREAARLALQKMEKTVEINENCQFLEDLEMLRTAPAPHLPSAEETSPYHSPNGIGGFQLQGCNPLEQLGLFMKMDDDEEEEGEPSNVPEQPNDVDVDVEDGEID